MAAIRHIAAIPGEQEQRCLRCCEVITSLKAAHAPVWPGSYVIVIGGKIFRNHLAGTDCEAVDLSEREAAAEVEVCA
jgi:hypothetical protein